MADDFSLDPLQIQEDLLNNKYKAALATKLRASNASTANWDIAGQANNAYDRVSSVGIMAQDAKQRQALGDQYQRSMEAALEGAPPEIKAQVLSAGTREQGLKSFSRWNNIRSDQRERAAMDAEDAKSSPTGPSLGGGAVGAGDVTPVDPAIAQYSLDYKHAQQMIRSSDPDTSARGKAWMETLKLHGPDSNMIQGRNGQVMTAPGSSAALAAGVTAKKGAEYPFTDKPTMRDAGGGQMEYSTEHRDIQRGGGGPQPSAPVSALPGATGAAPTVAPASAPISPVSALPGATGAGTPPPSAAPVAQTGSALPGATGGMRAVPGGMQVPPEVQMQRDGVRAQILYQEYQSLKNQPPTPQTQSEMNAVSSEINMLMKQYGGKLPGPTPPALAPGNNVTAGPGGEPPPQQGGPQQKAGPEMFLDPSTRIVPPTNNPGMAEQFKVQRAQQQAQMTKIAEANANAPVVMANMEELKRLAASPTYHSTVDQVKGWVGQNVGSMFDHSGKSTPEYSNTAQMLSVINATIGPYVKLLGSNPSDADRSFTQEEFPKVGEDEATRLKKIDIINRRIQNTIEANSFVENAVNQGYTVTGAQNAYLKWKAYQKQQEQQAPGNPTPAGSGQPAPASALPSAVSAAQANPAAYPQGQDTPGRGGNGIWSREFAGDLANSAVSLPGALMAQGGPAMKDSFGNVVEGTKELVGMGNRPAAMAEIERQNQLRKTDPQYNQARAFTDITGNPTSYVPGMSIPKIVGAGVLQGATQPQPTFSKQAEEGFNSGAIALGLGLASKVVPTTETSAARKGLLDEFPSVRPTSSQLTPGTQESKLAAGLGLNDAASLKQVKAITKDLMDKSGIKGEGITLDTLKTAKDELGAARSALLPEKMGNANVLLKVSTQDQNAIKQSIDDITRVPGASQAVTGAAGPQGVQKIMNDANAPNLGKIYAAFTGNNPVRLSPKVLDEAWKEVSLVAENPQAAGSVRKVLEDIMSRGMSPETLAQFKDLNRKMGNVHDLERIVLAGGGGKGAGAGFLAPSKIEALAKESLNPGSDIQKAMELINSLRIQDPRAGLIVPGTSTTSNVMRAVREPVGWVANKVDEAINSVGRHVPDFAKPIVRSLRRPQNLQPGMTEFNKETQDAP